MSSLGVGLRAIQFLFDADPGTFLLKDALVHDGSWPHLQELERAGYITHKVIQSADGKFVRLELTAKGKELQRALARP